MLTGLFFSMVSLHPAGLGKESWAWLGNMGNKAPVWHWAQR